MNIGSSLRSHVKEKLRSSTFYEGGGKRDSSVASDDKSAAPSIGNRLRQMFARRTNSSKELDDGLTKEERRLKLLTRRITRESIVLNKGNQETMKFTPQKKKDGQATEGENSGKLRTKSLALVNDFKAKEAFEDGLKVKIKDDDNIDQVGADEKETKIEDIQNLDDIKEAI